jgi:DNA (cytosine-5)-methyltransferase 1
MKPRLLDLFCGAGGCTKGYQRAGFYVVGVDIEPQPNYCGDEFFQFDALRVLRNDRDWPSGGGDVPPEVYNEWAMEWRRVRLDRFDAFHASPPCQRWAGGFVKDRGRHPDYIAETREHLRATGLPYVIENVRGAPLLEPTIICGGGLGLKAGALQLHRHRYFETNFPMMGVPCARIARHTVSVVGNGTPSGNRITIGRNPSIAEKREAMGVGWTTRQELSEAIPPAYTEHIGHYLMAEIKARQAS